MTQTWPLRSPNASAAAVVSPAIGSPASSRPPHEMSKPPPPGETTPPSAGSVAATPPMAKPYPQCTSGMAYEAPTIPGSVATLATWSIALSASRSSASEAKTTPGTRISPLGSRRNRYGPSACSFMMSSRWARAGYRLIRGPGPPLPRPYSPAVRADEGARRDDPFLQRDPQVLRGEPGGQPGRLGQAVQPEIVPVRLVAGRWMRAAVAEPAVVVASGDRLRRVLARRDTFGVRRDRGHQPMDERA